ncbi:MAG TPA: TonB-dependent receptor [Casimicrobiaceae bacterium]|nr:TonB-dependent receptor [Casimicrobiaceae bacterium]
MLKSRLGAWLVAIALAMPPMHVLAQTNGPRADAVGGASIAGTLKDAVGKPLSNVVITVRAADGSEVARTVSDRAGAFRIENVPAGRYTLATDTVILSENQRAVTLSETGTLTLALVAAPTLPLAPVQIVARRLNESRQNLAPDIGADVYHFDRQDILDLPAGDATSLNQVLLQATGVTQDSFGQLHVRGDHANLQYRLNGVIIPESIAGFGQTLSTRFADQINLIEGALPAQYGYRTAGVVDITTKGGAFDQGGRIGYFGGSHNTNQVYGDVGGAVGDFTYYATGSWMSNNLGIEAPTSDRDPLHDHTTQGNGFGYFSYHLNQDTRLNLILGSAENKFEIPNTPGQMPSFELAGAPDLPSSDLNQRQNEKTRLAVLALQGIASDRIDYQLAGFYRYSSVRYLPDQVGDLIYTGVAGSIYRQNELWGTQGDLSYRLNEKNTLRTGFYYSRERIATDNSSQVFPADADGNQTSTIPFTIVDNTGSVGRQLGFYLQDAWQPIDDLTVNFGVRWDRVNSFVSQSQWSPRIGAVWKATPALTLHAGYARYFTPPPSELVTDATISKFEGTTNQQPSTENSPVKSERSNYYDAGVTYKVTQALSVGLDGYYRDVTDLLDEGQFGSALIFTPFNYAKGHVYGVEFSGNYRDSNFSAYLNVAYSKAQGNNIVSSQFNFDPDELTYIADHFIYLDHDQTWTGSAGASYTWQETTFSVSALYGSGLRRGFANTEHVPSYTQVDLGVSRNFVLPGIGKILGRFTIVNVFDKSYELRDGSGVGVGAPQFGPRRAFYAAVEKPFNW